MTIGTGARKANEDVKLYVSARDRTAIEELLFLVAKPDHLKLKPFGLD